MDIYDPRLVTLSFSMMLALSRLHKSGCTTKEDGYRLDIFDLGSRGIVISMGDETMRPLGADIRITCPCILYLPLLNSKTRLYKGLHYFLIFALKHMV